MNSDYLIRPKHRAFLRGIAISGTSMENNFALRKGGQLNQQIAEVKQLIDYTALMGFIPCPWF